MPIRRLVAHGIIPPGGAKHMPHLGEHMGVDYGVARSLTVSLQHGEGQIHPEGAADTFKTHVWCKEPG